MKSIALLAFDDALMTSLSLPAELLNAANHLLWAQRKRSSLEMHLVSATTKAPTLSGMIKLDLDNALDPQRVYDMVIIPSRWRHPHRSMTAPLSDWLILNAQSGADVCAVGNGSYLLAACGLLDGRPATTHWHYFDDFSRRYPRVRLQRDYLMTESDNLYCTGSVNSAADIIIHLIEKHWGTHTAQRVTRQFSPESRRPFQRNAFREDRRVVHSDEVVAMAQDWLARNFAENVNIDALATANGTSLRSFQRRFQTATGLSPQQYLQQLRLVAAEELLRNSNLSIADIGDHCGFHDSSYFCKQFRRHVDMSPGQYRKAVRRKLFTTDKSVILGRATEL